MSDAGPSNLPADVLDRIVRERFPYPSSEQPTWQTLRAGTPEADTPEADTDGLPDFRPADVAVIDRDTGRIVMLAIIEAEEGFDESRVLDRWLPASKRAPLYVFVPESNASRAARLAHEFGIRLAGLRSVGLAIREVRLLPFTAPLLQAFLPPLLRPARFRGGGGSGAPPRALPPKALPPDEAPRAGPPRYLDRLDLAAFVVLWALITAVSEILLALVVHDMIFPTVGAEEANEVDRAFKVMSYMAAPVFGLVVAVLIYGIPRYRSNGAPEGTGAALRGRGAVPVVWLGLTTALAIVVMIFPGLIGHSALRANPEGDLTVTVEAFRWDWRMTYEDSGVTVQGARGDALVLPVDTRIEFNVTSLDILHSFWIPAFRLKIDAVPHEFHAIYLTTVGLGTSEDIAYRVQCAELCGTGHPIMAMPVRVVERGEYDAWIASKQSGATGGGVEAANALDVAVSLVDFGVEPAQTAIAAGAVRFAVQNDGAAPHELVVIRTDAAADALPLAGPMVDEAAVDVRGRTDLLTPDASGAVTVDLEAGRYVLICNVPGHYPLGMRAAITVE